MALVSLTASSAAITAVLARRSRMARLLAVVTLLGSLLLVQAPGLARLIHVRPLHADDLAIALLAAVVVVAVFQVFAVVGRGVARRARGRHLAR